MFDDLDSGGQNMAQAGQNNMPQAPQAPVLSNKVEDIFSETDQTPKPAPLKPRQSERSLPEIKPEGDGLMKKIAIFAILIIVVVGITFGAIWLFKKIDAELIRTENLNFDALKVGNNEEKKDNTEKNAELEESITEENGVEFFPPESEVSNLPIDIDQDGLTDEEEKAAGTDPNNYDSDNDGLFDREEIDIYKSDPLNSDTDADGYTDGQEVKSGYNPIGEGRLNEVK